MEVLAHNRHTRRLSLITSLIAGTITFLLLITYQYISGHRQFEEELQAQAAIIATNSAAALAFDDHDAANENLAAIRKTRRILGAALYDERGDLFTLIDDPGAVFPVKIDPENPETPPRPFTDTGAFKFLMRVEVLQDGTRVGSLLLLGNRKPLYLSISAYAGGLIVVGLIALFLARRFTSALRRKMALTAEQLEQMALYDQITGLPNRRLFEHELKKAIVRVKRDGNSAALLMIDVDNFKNVNDLCGHLVGDEVLAMIASRLKRAIRTDDVLARVGGDEFAAILFLVGDPENAGMLAERMIKAIAPPFPTQPIPSHVGLSIGIAMLPEDSDDPETLIRWSDMAMYEAKRQGKNRAQFFSEEINRKIHASLHLEAQLRQAIIGANKGLHVAYQPQVCAKTRKIIGVEALTRWTRSDGTSISPGEFIPVAEKSGMIVDLGAWLIHQVCEDISWMEGQGIVLDKVAINVSPKELTKDSTIVENARQALRKFGKNPGIFQFEITENALMAEHGADILNALRREGFSLAIDDFGTGYSSLGYLKRFQVGTLKIDQSFIRRLPEDADDAAIVSAVIQMAGALGINVVAEGVETAEQAEFLETIGCNILQGYLFSRPLQREAFVDFFRSNMH